MGQDGWRAETAKENTRQLYKSMYKYGVSTPQFQMYIIQMSISDGLGSRKLEVLADTAVTLEQSTDGAVVTEVIKKILKVMMLGEILHILGKAEQVAGAQRIWTSSSKHTYIHTYIACSMIYSEIASICFYGSYNITCIRAVICIPPSVTCLVCCGIDL